VISNDEIEAMIVASTRYDPVRADQIAAALAPTIEAAIRGLIQRGGGEAIAQIEKIGPRRLGVLCAHTLVTLLDGESPARRSFDKALTRVVHRELLKPDGVSTEAAGRVLAMVTLESTGAAHLEVVSHQSVLQASPVLFAAIEKAILEHTPPRLTYLPMVDEPCEGGYLTSSLQRTKIAYRHREHATIALEGEWLQTVDRLQKQSFRLNHPLLLTAKEHLARRSQAPGMPSMVDPAPMRFSHRLEGKQFRYWRRRNAHAVHTARHQRLRFLRTIQAAQLYEDEPLYFPLRADFRGRLYTLPNLLSYQGDDLGRALVRLHDTRKPDADATDAIDVYGARLFTGKRMQPVAAARWVREKERQTDDFFREADRPWIARAWWESYASKATVFSTPIYIDATASGLQMIACVTRDEAIAYRTNLSGSSVVKDPYWDVAFEAESRVLADNHVSSQHWVQFFGGAIPRSIVKGCVLARPFGLEFHGHLIMVKDGVEEWIRWHGGELPCEPEYFHTWTNSLAFHIWKASELIFPGALAFEGWASAVAKASHGKPIAWKLPDGFVALHGKEGASTQLVKTEEGKLPTRLPNPRYSLREHERSLSANLIHSFDGYVLRETARRFWAKGGASLIPIHDAYGVHANDVKTLREALREAYRALTEADLLAKYTRQWSLALGVSLPDPPTVGTFDPARLSGALIAC
jgi:DNA-directed RNA polymerase